MRTGLFLCREVRHLRSRPVGEVSIPQATFPAVTSHAVKHGVAVPPPLMPTLQMYKIYFQITTLSVQIGF